MRYADSGGLTAEGGSRREQIRLLAAKMFAEEPDAKQIARSLRVSTKSDEGGAGGLAGELGFLPLALAQAAAVIAAQHMHYPAYLGPATPPVEGSGGRGTPLLVSVTFRLVQHG